MACLNTTSKSLTIELTGSPATQAQWTVHYATRSGTDFTESSNDGVTNSTTPVTMIAAPDSGETISIRDITVYNADVSSVTIVIKLVNGGNSRILYRQTLDTLESWSSLAQKGKDGAQGLTGSVSAASGLILDESSAPNTATNQGALYVPSSDNLLRYRGESNGTERRIALIDTTNLATNDLFYYGSDGLFKRIAIGTLDQVLVAKPSGNPPYQFATVTGQEVLTGNRTYYVRTDGNDSNNGLTDATGGAFLTPQKAFNVADTIIKNGYKITIQLANGTYSITSSIKIKGDDIGDIELVGNPTTPSNVVIQSNSSITLFEKVNVGNIEINGIKVQSNGNTPDLVCFNVSNGILKYKNIDFGATTTGTLGAGNNAHFYVINRGGILATGNATITGNAAYHIFVFYNGIVLDDYLFNPSSPISSTLTLSGSREFVYFVRLLGGEYRQAASRRTISGSATGIRYSIGGGGRCITGGGANYFPGNSTVPVETASYSYYT